LGLDPSTRSVTRPEDLQIDLGGMIKGATVDKASVCLEGRGAIDAGGDAALRGRDPRGGPWLVDVEDPSDGSRTMATVALSDRAVATSAANRRRWRVGDSLAHHLVDPRTRAPAETDVLQATVVAPTVELADVLAKVAFLLGSAQARRFLERQPDVGAVLVRRTGDLVVVGDVDLRDTADA
jgi:thiamine biosynthesis lipoprotein